MPPQTADLATTWAFLEEGVDHIMTKLQTGVSYSKYMSLYTVAYNYCTSSKMPSNTSEPSVAGRCLSLSSPSGYLVLTYSFSRC
jgi:cullin 1